MKPLAMFHVVAIVTLLALTRLATGATIGGIEIRSATGDPLHAVATLTLGEAEQIDAKCMSIMARNEKGADIELASPTLFALERREPKTVSLHGGQVHFEKGTSSQKVEVRSIRPVNERIVYLTVTMRCGVSATRTFAVFVPDPDSAAKVSRESAAQGSSGEAAKQKVPMPEGLVAPRDNDPPVGLVETRADEPSDGVRLRLAPLLSLNRQ